jgi:hypothetical protein
VFFPERSLLRKHTPVNMPLSARRPPSRVAWR